MRINVYALSAAVIALSSLFLPWLSHSSTFFQSTTIVGAMSYSYSPFEECASMVVLNGSSMSLLARYGPDYWSPSPHYFSISMNELSMLFVFSFVVALLYVYAVALMTQASFASGSWSGTGKRISIVASNLSFLCIFLYLTSVVWRLDLSSMFSFGFQHGGWWSMRNSVGVNVFYLDVGFWIAILGTVSAFISWLHPWFIDINTGVGVRKVDALKRWLPVSEWEKIVVIATVSFLAVFLFVIFYLPLP